MNRFSILRNQLSQCGKDRPTGQNVPDYLKLTPGPTESLTCGGTSEILPMERKKATFNIEELYDYLNGGKELSKRRQFIQSVVTKDYHEFHDKYNNSRDEYVADGVNEFIKVHKAYKNFKPTRDDMLFMGEVSVGFGALNNSHGIFMSTVVGQGSEEQVRFWVPKILNFEITGSYAQTELGHGSNVRGLQTTATLDTTTDEFVLNTPNLRSIKWWPGCLGKVATHCTLYAQLIINGKEHGLSVFMVQLRDENHLPLKGVRLGDLGMKVGDNANDTGFLMLDNVRIPRENMLSKFKKVAKDGSFEIVKGTDPKVHYATMIGTRASMVNTAAARLSLSATIAVRYSCVRTQGFVDTKPGVSYKTPEHQIIDHQVQQYRLLKQLATAYALKFTARWMIDLRQKMEGGNKSELGVITNSGLLKEFSASSAGLKSLTSQIAIAGSEDLRKACGGNGYLLNSGIAALTCDYVWQVTAEGDMVILALSTARHIVSTITNIVKGKKVDSVFDYFNVIDSPSFDVEKHRPARAKSEEDFFSFKFLTEVFKYRSLCKNFNAWRDFTKLVAVDKIKFEVAWDMCSIDLMNATYAHCYYVIILNFVEKIGTAPSQEIKKVLTQLCVLFAASLFNENNFSDVFDSEEMQFVGPVIKKTLKAIRPNAVALVDAFGFSDGVLKSTIGRYDGNVYEALFDAAQRSTLNQTDPFDGYKYLKPHLNTKLLAHGNKSLAGVKF